MQPTGTECGRCERRRLRRRVDTLQEAVMSRDRRIADLEAENRRQDATLEDYARSYMRACDLAARPEGERDDLNRKVRELEDALARARWTLHSEEKCKARIAELEAECERMAAVNHGQGVTIESYAQSYKAVCDLAARLEGERDDWHAAADRSGAIGNDLTRRVRELEEQRDAYANEVLRLEPFEPRPGRLLRFREARSVMIKPAGQCSTFHHVVDTVEIRF